MTYAYDAASRRTQMTYADGGFYVNYDYDAAGDLTKIRENGATTGVGVLGLYAYDDRGRRTSLTRGNGATTSYSYDNVDRRTQIVQTLPGSTSYNLTLGDSYDPASGIVSHTQSNDAYAWGGHYAVNRNYTTNGLNQYTATGAITPTYDTRGNVTSAGSITYGYSSENQLISATGSVQMGYDALGRLAWTTGSPNFTSFAYDGQSLIAEYDYSGNLVRRYVFGPGTDEPLVQYDGTGTSTRHWFHADERGSIVATSDGSGAMSAINTYDEHGIPGASNSGRFQYTGQAWLPEIGMYYYRARIYSPTLGRFMQTDPIGYGGGMNLYAYVGGDPVNGTDPTGTECAEIVEAHGGDCAGTTARTYVDAKILTGVIPSYLRDGLVDYVTQYLRGEIGLGDVFSYVEGRMLSHIDLSGTFESPAPYGAAFFHPLNSIEQREIDILLSSPNMQMKMQYAWGQTLATGLEHGFYITAMRIGSGIRFFESPVWTGEASDMGWAYGYMMSRMNDFFASFHTHFDTYFSAQFPSIQDINIGAAHHSIVIIQSRWGISYGH